MKLYWHIGFAMLLAICNVPIAARSLAEIKASGELRVCVAGSSADFYQRNGADFARFLGVHPIVTKLEKWDEQFQNSSGAIDKSATYESSLLALGKCDVFPNDLHILNWRQTKMLLVPYYTTRKLVVAHRDLRDVIRQPSDLGGRKAAVQKDTAYDSWLREQNEKTFVTSPVIVEYASTAESMRKVAEKLVNFTVVGAESSFKWVRSDIRNLDILFPVDEPVQVGWGISPRASDLQSSLTHYFDENARVASELDQSWRENYGISLMEYKLFDASFSEARTDWRAILLWVLPIATGMLGIILAMFYWTRRLRRLLLQHERTETELRVSQEKIARDSALDLKISRISVSLQQSDDALESFGRILLSELISELGCCVGAFFTRAPHGDAFSCVVAHGISRSQCSPIRPGEGVAGAVLVTKQIARCSNLPPGFLPIQSGTLNVNPGLIEIIPIVESGEVLALIELGYISPVQDWNDILDRLLPVVTYSLGLMLGRIAAAHEKSARFSLSDSQPLVLDSLPDGIIVFDDEGLVSFANAAACTNLGFSKTEFLGFSIQDLGIRRHKDGSYLPIYEIEMKSTSTDGTSDTYVKELFWCKSGSSILVECTTIPLVINGSQNGKMIVFREASRRDSIRD